jgi:hypothetical protein
MSEGTLTGDRINARIAMPGGDWYSPGFRAAIAVSYDPDRHAVNCVSRSGQRLAASVT